MGPTEHGVTGSRAVGSIAPNETLIFVVNLLKLG